MHSAWISFLIWYQNRLRPNLISSTHPLSAAFLPCLWFFFFLTSWLQTILSSTILVIRPLFFPALLVLLYSSITQIILVHSLFQNGDNYNFWHRAIKISLSAKNKTGFITGKIKEPHKASNPKEHALSQRCNDMVLSWIINSLEPQNYNMPRGR